jgi:elongation factor Ts
MTVSIEQIKKLRAETGAGVLDCRNVLEEADGDFDRAVELIREKGLAKAAKRADREATEGVLELYSHGDGRIGVMVEVNCETDFVARSDAFREFAHEIALQIAALGPRWVHDEDIPEEVLNQEKEAIRQHFLDEGKPEEVLDRIVEGRMKKFKDEVCLMRQAYIRDEDLSIQDYLHETVAALGENIVIRRFVRWEVGESDASE